MTIQPAYNREDKLPRLGISLEPGPAQPSQIRRPCWTDPSPASHKTTTFNTTALAFLVATQEKQVTVGTFEM